MTKRFCDRCLKEMPSMFDESKTSYPQVKMSIRKDCGYFYGVDLCPECSAKVVAFVEPIKRPFEIDEILGAITNE